MRFISPIANYRLIAVHQQTEPLADGTRRVVEEGFAAEFKQSDVTDWERQIARESFQFKGTVITADTKEPVDPITRVSSFDTNTVHATSCRCDKGKPAHTAGCVKLRERVEKALLDNDDFGKPDGYILVEKPLPVAPWPAYLELKPHGQLTPERVAARNLETAKATGVSVHQLVDFERQTRGHERILAAYEAATAEPEPEPVVAA